jgi:hypothetical protein
VAAAIRNPSPVENLNINSIVEEEPESLIDHDDEQEWIKNHRHVLIEENMSIPDYF